MIDIIVNEQLACVCLPELVTLIVQALVPNLGLGYKLETKRHDEQKKDAE